MVLLALLGVPLAAAQDSDRNTADKLEAIRQQMEKGQGFYVAGQFAEAAKVFEAGYRNSPYSAFLFNAGVCYQKLKDYSNSLAKFQEYLKVDPQAPDAGKVKERVELLTAAVEAQAAAEAAKANAQTPGAAGAGPEPPTPVIVPEDSSTMKSLVVIETEPAGAPIRLYARTTDSAAPFKVDGDNAGWSEIAARRSPANLTLDVGRYHIVVDKYLDFNVSETDVDVSPGHVHHFKANLSQGAFLAFLRVSAKALDPDGGEPKNLRQAYVFLDDEKQQRAPWGRTPHGELIAPGQHVVVVEAPGFEPLRQALNLEAGEQKELSVSLGRVPYGYLRIDSNATEVKVLIDEKPVGTWRSGEVALQVRASSGKHRLKVLSDGRKTFDGDIVIPRGRVLPVHVDMKAKWPRGAAWTQAIIGAAFIGAGAYFGLESDKLNDQLEADRSRGVLAEGDSRVTRGRWYSVGADAAFAVGGVLGILATYNFIKDPVPPSSYKAGEPLEFNDPREARGKTAERAVRRDRQFAVRRRDEDSTISFGALVGPDSAGFALKGTF